MIDEQAACAAAQRLMGWSAVAAVPFEDEWFVRDITNGDVPVYGGPRVVVLADGYASQQSGSFAPLVAIERARQERDER